MAGDSATATKDNTKGDESSVGDQSVDKTAAGGQTDNKDQQADEGQKSEGERTDTLLTTGEKPEAEPESKSAPETYSDFTLPEGFTLDDDSKTAFTTMAKEMDLKQDQAQKVIDLYVKNQQSQAGKAEQYFKEEYERNVKAVQDDQEIGGVNYADKVKLANSVITKFGNAQVDKVLKGSLFANHPEVVRMFYKIGKAMSEDTLVDPDDGGEGGTTPKPIEKRVYPDM